MAKNISLNYTDDVINSEGRVSSTGKSILKSFENVRFLTKMADGTIHRFRLQASLYDEGKAEEKAKSDKPALAKASVTVD